MAYANSSCFKSRAHHQAGAGRGHHPVGIASALCRVGLSHCRGRLRSRCHPRARIARPNHLLAAAACALCLAAARIANRRVALGPRPCSARALLCATVAVSPPGPAFASPAATLVPRLDSLGCLRTGLRPASPSPRRRVAVSVGWYYPQASHAAFRRLLQWPCERLSGAHPEVPHGQASQYRALTSLVSHTATGPPLSPLSPCRRDLFFQFAVVGAPLSNWLCLQLC